MNTTTEPQAVRDAAALPQLRRLAAASREATELQWERERVERLARERSKAVYDATHSVRIRFPATLAQLLTEGSLAFTGYPALNEGDEVDLPVGPCAVAYLGEGVWLYHTEARASGMVRGRPTLVIPCVCGRYREARVDDDYALARELDHMDANRDVCLGTCLPCGGHSNDDTDDEDVW